MGSHMDAVWMAIFLACEVVAVAVGWTGFPP